MRILAINYEYPPLGGGGGVVFQQIVESLADRHSITVITSAFEGLERRERHGTLDIHRVPVLMRRGLSTASLPSLLSYWPASWAHARALLRHERFDVINSHFVVPSSPSADQIARRHDLPHVLSIHGGDIFDPSKRTSPHRLPVVRGLVRRLLDRADRVVAQSRNTAENARRYYGASREIDVIPLGIRPMPHPRVSRIELGIEDDRFVVVTVGRLVARKAIDELLRVIADLSDPRLLLVVVGDGPLRTELESLAASLGIRKQVRFTGFIDVDEKVRLLAAADLFASTSMHEGFGLVFLEAMDQGLPVLCYDHGGQTDFLEDGRTGALVAAGDRTTFLAALRRLRHDPDLRQTCREHNRRVVREFYVDRCADRYESMFEEVLRERGVGRVPAVLSPDSAGPHGS